MRVLALAALVPLVFGQHYQLNLDCNDYPGPCNNDCYAVYTAGKDSILNYNGPNQAGQRRNEAGCGYHNPCNKGKMALPKPDENSCDEYPYASSVEGGSESILRCTENEENAEEGRQLGRFLRKECEFQPCTFMVTFGNFYTSATPYCRDSGGANDGFEYQFLAGKYQLHSRDTNVTQEDQWVLHEPNPAHFFPPHLRREFLLEDGSRTVLPTRNMTASYDGKIFHTFRNGTVIELRAVRELFGMDKSPSLRDPSLHE